MAMMVFLMFVLALAMPLMLMAVAMLGMFVLMIVYHYNVSVLFVILPTKVHTIACNWVANVLHGVFLPLVGLS